MAFLFVLFMSVHVCACLFLSSVLSSLPFMFCVGVFFYVWQILINKFQYAHNSNETYSLEHQVLKPKTPPKCVQLQPKHHLIHAHECFSSDIEPNEFSTANKISVICYMTLI